MSTLTAGSSSVQFKEAVLRKCRESAEMKAKFFEANGGVIETVCTRLARALADGHKLFVMGNGGSSCDAVHVAVEFVHPIIEKRKAFPAFALTNDTVLLTAIRDRVRLHPRKKADIFDIALDGKIAIVESVERDFENNVHLAVTVEDDPGRDFGTARQIGHRFFFGAEEVELV